MELTPMQPVITTMAEKKLVGKRVLMSLIENKTPTLWRSFLLHHKDIRSRVSDEFVSMSVYSEPLRLGDLHQEFYKWAAVEVLDFDSVSDEMEPFILTGGPYAVFHYQGPSTDNSIFVYIFGTWLPNSTYDLDDRPHFEILGNKYKNEDQNSEEDIWIPIRPKQ